VKKRRRAFALVALGLGLVVALAAGEVAVRVAGVTSSPRRHFRPGIYVADPDLGWALAPRYAGVHVEYAFEAPTTTNARGFRGPGEWETGRAVRVLALGDSCTFGRGVADAETWPARLEARLRARGVDVAVFNAGVPGYDTVQELALLRRLGPELRPTHVIVGWLPNDVIEKSVDVRKTVQLLDGQLVDDVEQYREWKAQVEGGGLHGSALYRFLRVRTKLLKAALGSRRDGAGGVITDEQLAYSQAPLRELIAEASALGAKPIVVLFPREEEVVPPLSDATHHDRMEAFARGLGAEVVNLAPRWRAQLPAGTLYLPRDPVHLTPGGYDAVAAEVDATVR
jgi:lysophospholipase L1-like esterase